MISSIKKIKPFLWCFGIILLIELVVVSNPESRPFRIITKPLVVVSLLVFFLMQQVDKKTRILVTVALVFSLIGDVQLIYAGEYDYLFTGGVTAFVFAHIMYVIQFSRSRNKNTGVLVPLIILLFYAVALFWYLMDSLNGFMIPIVIYMASLLIMILFAYLRNDEISDNSYIYVLIGALLFMLSDSIIAITRFKSDIPFSRAMVMGIYGIAQLCMVLGILKSDPIYKMQNAKPNNGVIKDEIGLAGKIKQ